MSVLQMFREVIKQRLKALLWRSIATEFETDAILDEAENLDRIEQQVRRLENEGKSHIAELIRQRANSLDMDSPGGSVAKSLEQLGSDSNGKLNSETFMPRPDVPMVESSSPKPKRRRRKATETNPED